MRTHTEEELAQIIEDHAKWMMGEGGSRAYLRGAYLRGADLRRADLSGADLRGADLSGADLRDAYLSGAVHAWAQVSFAGHGECGRMLTAVRYKAGDAITYQCGCFMGTAEELIDYIARGDSRLKATRTRAFEMVNELIQLRNP